MDIKAKNADGEIIIEIQNTSELYYLERILYGVCKAVTEHIYAVMIQNDVLGTARLEGLMEGRAEGRAEGREEGRAEGMAESIANEKLNTARRMRTLNVPLTTIMEVTGLSEHEIMRIDILDKNI